MPPTLATRLGTTTHVSALLRRAARLGLAVPGDLHTLAVQRGCRHYWQGTEPAGELVSRADFTNEELALALLNVALDYDAHSIRCGAAMLGAEGMDPLRVARIAKLERSEQVVRYVAECGRRFEPGNDFWTQLLAALPATPAPKDGALPHPTRFVAMTGYVRGVGVKTVTEWQRPQLRKQAA